MKFEETMKKKYQKSKKEAFNHTVRWILFLFLLNLICFIYSQDYIYIATFIISVIFFIWNLKIHLDTLDEIYEEILDLKTIKGDKNDNYKRNR